MKKAKLFLVAIAVFGIVGGVMAFKAQRLGNTLFCASASQPSNCSLDGSFATYFAPGENYVTTTGSGITAFCTTQETQPCTASTTYTTATSE